MTSEYDAQLRASSARQLNANALFHELLDKAVNGWVSEWGSTSIEEVGRREYCYAAYSAMRDLRQVFDNEIMKAIDDEPK